MVHLLPSNLANIEMTLKTLFLAGLLLTLEACATPADQPVMRILMPPAGFDATALSSELARVAALSAEQRRRELTTLENERRLDDGAYGALAALLERERTGRGQVVRTSLLAAIVGVHAFQGTRTTVAGEVPKAQGNHHPSIAPYGLFNCRGGKVQISVGSQKLWATFATAFGIDPECADFATNADRVNNRRALIERIEDSFSAYEAESLLERLNDLGIPAGKVRTLDEVFEWEQVRSQGLLIDVDHPVLGKISLPGPPLRFFGQGEVETTQLQHSAPPLLDGEGAAIRRWLAESEGSAPDGDDRWAR